MKIENNRNVGHVVMPMQPFELNSIGLNWIRLNSTKLRETLEAGWG